MTQYIENVVVGKVGLPIIDEVELLALNKEDFEQTEKEKTLYTNERYLPKILVEIGVVKSTSEVRRNKPQFNITLDEIGYREIKWGKRKIFIVVGE